jgi:hypothetical protein
VAKLWRPYHWPSKGEIIMTTATIIEEAVVEKLRLLPPDKQQEALDFVESLHQETEAKQPRLSLEGIWEDLNVSITKEEIDEARREMWANFPRERFFTEEHK